MDEMERVFSATNFLIDLEEDDVIGCDEIKHSLWGKLLTDKPYNSKAMLAVLKKNWNLTKGVDVKEFENGLFCFTFACEVDLKKVEDRGPWNFAGHALLTKRWEPEIAPSEIVFDQISLWVQFSGLPLEWHKPKAIDRIGGMIGKVSEVDIGEGGQGRRTARARIQLGINSSLLPGTWIRRKTREPLWISFKYERLSFFCHYCGCVGHETRVCLEGKEKTEMFDPERSLYGRWLRVECSDFLKEEVRALLLTHSGEEKVTTETMAIITVAEENSLISETHLDHQRGSMRTHGVKQKLNFEEKTDGGRKKVYIQEISEETVVKENDAMQTIQVSPFSLNTWAASGGGAVPGVASKGAGGKVNKQSRTSSSRYSPFKKSPRLYTGGKQQNLEDGLVEVQVDAGYTNNSTGVVAALNQPHETQ